MMAVDSQDQNNALDLREFKQFFFGRSGVTQERQQVNLPACGVRVTHVQSLDLSRIIKSIDL